MSKKGKTDAYRATAATSSAISKARPAGPDALWLGRLTGSTMPAFCRVSGKTFVDQAARSNSGAHWPSEASEFIFARWTKARWAASTFSALPPHAAKASA